MVAEETRSRQVISSSSTETLKIVSMPCLHHSLISKMPLCKLMTFPTWSSCRTLYWLFKMISKLSANMPNQKSNVWIFNRDLLGKRIIFFQVESFFFFFQIDFSILLWVRHNKPHGHFMSTPFFVNSTEGRMIFAWIYSSYIFCITL